MTRKSAVRFWLILACVLFYVIYKLSGGELGKSWEVIKGTLSDATKSSTSAEPAKK